MLLFLWNWWTFQRQGHFLIISFFQQIWVLRAKHFCLQILVDLLLLGSVFKPKCNNVADANPPCNYSKVFCNIVLKKIRDFYNIRLLLFCVNKITSLCQKTQIFKINHDWYQNILLETFRNVKILKIFEKYTIYDQTSVLKN